MSEQKQPQKRRFRRSHKILGIVVILLVVLYAVRSIFISPVVYWLAGNAARDMGAKEIRIERITGSYLGDLQFHEFSMIGADNSWELKADRVEIEYALFASIFGGRFARRIKMVRPEITIGELKESESQKPAEIPDIAEILEQMPDLEIIDASLSWQGQKFALGGMAWNSSAHKSDVLAGSLSIGRIQYAEIALPAVQGTWQVSATRGNPATLDRFALEFGNRTVAALSGSLTPGNEGKIELKGQITIPSLSRDVLSLLRLSATEIPLEGDLEAKFTLHGSLLSRPMSLAADVALRLQHPAWQGKSLPDAVLTGKIDFDGSAVAVSGVTLNLGQSEVGRLNGKLAFPAAPGTEVTTSLSMNSRQIQELAAVFLGPDTMPMSADISVALRTGGDVLSHFGPVAVECSLDHVQLQGKSLPPIALRGECSAGDDFVEISTLTLTLDNREMCSIKGRVGLGPKIPLDCRVMFRAERIEEVLSQLPGMPELSGDVSASLHVTGEVLPSLTLATVFEADVKNGQWQGSPFPALSLAGTCSADENTLFVDCFRLSLDGKKFGKLRGKLSGDLALSLLADLEGEEIENLVSTLWQPGAEKPDFPWTKGSSAALSLKGSLGKPLSLSASVSVNAAGGKWREICLPPLAIDGELQLDENAFELSRMGVKLNGRELCTAQGKLGGDSRLDLTADLDGRKIEEFLATGGKDALPLTGDLAGTLRFRGDFSQAQPMQLSASGELRFTRGTWGGVDLPSLTAQGDLGVSENEIECRRVTLHLGEEEIVVGGKIGCVPGAATDLTANFQMERIQDVIAPIARAMGHDVLPFTADAGGTLKIQGKLVPLDLDALLSLGVPQWSWQGQEIAPGSIGATCHFDDKNTSVSGKLTVKERGTADVEAKISREGAVEFALDLRLEAIQELLSFFGESVPNASANADVSIRAQGRLPVSGAMDMTASVSLKVSPLTWQGRFLPDLTLDGRCSLEAEKLMISRLAFNLGAEEVGELKGDIGLTTGKIYIQSEFEIEKIEGLLAVFEETPSMKGSLRGSFRMTGTLPLSPQFALDVEAGLALTDGIFPPFMCKSLSFDGNFTVTEHTLTVRDLSIQWARENLADKLTVLDMKGFLGYCPGQDTDIIVRIPMASLGNRFLMLLGPKYHWQGEAPLTFTAKGRLPLAGEPMSLETRVDWPWRGENGGAWELKLAGLSLSGKAEEAGLGFYGKITGPLDNPTLDGRLHIAQPSVRIGPYEMREVVAEIVSDHREILVYGRVSLGGENLTCRGRITHSGLAPKKFKLSVEGERLPLIQGDGILGRGAVKLTWEGIVTASLYLFSARLEHYQNLQPGKVSNKLRDLFRQNRNVLSLDAVLAQKSADEWTIAEKDPSGKAAVTYIIRRGKDRLDICRPVEKTESTLKGNIDVTDLELLQPMSLDSAPKKWLEYPRDMSPDMDLDIGISFPRVLIHNDLLNLTARGNASIRGKADSPEIKGQLTADSGKLRLPQGTFSITRFTVGLRELSQPSLSIEAETRVADYLISARIQAPPDPPLIQFSSSPPLPVEKILSLLQQ